MFEIKILVRPGKLEDVLWALDRKIIGEPIIRPVRTEEEPIASKTAKPSQIKDGGRVLGDSLVAIIIRRLQSGNMDAVTLQQLKDWTVSAGRALTSYPSALQRLQSLGVLSKAIPGEKGERRKYSVLNLNATEASING